MTIDHQEIPWHARTLADVIEHMETNTKSGLTESEAAARLVQYGPNALREQPRQTFWQRLMAQFQSFVIYILIFAAVLSAVLGDWVEAAAIAAIIALNAVLGVIQEGKAEEALAALRKLSSPEARVIRGGHQLVIPSQNIVPGDLVILDAGNYVPADVRLADTMNLKIDESSLTGESMAVDKQANITTEERALIGDRRNMAYMSTTATYGRGRAIVVGTGMQTEIGKIADLIQSTEDEDTPLQQRLDQLGRTLSIGALAICLLVGVVIFGREITSGDFKLFEALEDSLLTAVALAIAAVPEGLPAIVTINLAIGMREMIRRNALIRRLPAVETLGSASVICSDKTGTLTQNQMTAVKLYVNGAILNINGHGYVPEGSFVKDGQPLELNAHPDARTLLLGGLLASDATLESSNESTFDEGKLHMIGDPTEGALVVAAAKADLWRGQVEDRYPRVNEIPFDAVRKRMSTIHEDTEGKGYTVYTKGAPEIVLEHCTTLLEHGQPIELTENRREAIQYTYQDMANEALRVLAVTRRNLETLPDIISPETIENQLTLIGLIAMMDPARPEVASAIDKARDAGIRTVMVTGDYPDTARAIAQEIGLLRENGRVLRGTEIDQLNAEQLATVIDDVDVFARVSPEHKVRIVEAFRARDHIVAMTGDGVNDAPALKRASIGIAMGITGTDVSKETADMVLTDDNYVSIVSAVEQGRVIYSNIRKFVYFLLSCNLSEIAVIFLGTLAGAPSPLTAIQLLWLNLLTDGAPALALGVEKGDPDVMNHPPRSAKEPIINFNMQVGMIVQTIVLTSVTLLAFAIGHNKMPDSWALARTMAFVTLSAAEVACAYTARSELNALHKIGFWTNKFMQYAAGTSVLLLVLVIYVPFLRGVFDTVALDITEWAILLPLILLPAIVAEITKIYLRQHAATVEASQSIR